MASGAQGVAENHPDVFGRARLNWSGNSLRLNLHSETGTTQRRHVPRLRASDPLRSSRVTTFLGGANAVRTTVFQQVGLLPDEFFYAHEETDLAWRALDAGWMIDDER